MRAGGRTLVMLALLVSSCSDDAVQVVVRNLDGPTDIAFACIGDLRLTASEDVIRSAQPLASCTGRSGGEVPPGQENLVAPDVYGFVLQSTRGTVAIVDTLAGTIADADPFAPGRNSIPIGTLPVGLVSDVSGCYAVSANAGSCDLSILDVASAVSLSNAAKVTRVPIVNASGSPILAKPRAIERGQLPSEEIGIECPATASGQLWVAFPGCNWVAAIDASSGAVTSGVRLLAGGGAEITDGDVSCPNQCGTGAAGDTDAGVPEPPDESIAAPVEVQLSPDGRTLYIGSQNSPELTIVELDEAGAPLSLRSVSLEGDVGITAIEVTDVVSIGGAFDSVGQVGVDFVFAYAIATDGSVRVVDVVGGVECDTQVDPRYLREQTNIEVLGCMAVGDAATPPRRPGARGPGIRLPSDAIPLDLAFATVDGGGGEQADPLLMSGTFAFVTASDGNVFIVNVDDDNYSDFEVPSDPSKVWMTLAVPHQLRDFLTDRDHVQNTTCGAISDEAYELPPRLNAGGLQIGFGVNPPVSTEKGRQLPRLRGVECRIEEGGSVIEQDAVGELSLAAPVAVRERAFPDLLSVANEDWYVTWEGSLSLDGIGSAVDGRPVRSGVMANDQGLVTVTEAGAPFCGLGVEPYDFLQIIGCDPARGDEQCGIGETCFVHPQTPSNVTTGMCLPADQVDELAGTCRDVLTTRRRYTITEAYAAQVVLGERARTLRTSPLAGCESSEQCQELAAVEDRLRSDAHPVELGDGVGPAGDAANYTWACQADSTHKPGPDRCVMVCEDSGDCEPGTVCSGGTCVQGKLPPDACTQAIQRYQVRAGEAFAVIGTRTGFLHNRIADPDTSQCVEDPGASPLLVGRIPLDAEECSGDGFTDLSPNPCLTTVTTYEEVTPNEPRTGTCVPGAVAAQEREVAAMRFSNPAFTVHLVDLQTTGDAVCNGDGEGGLEPYSPLFQDYSIGFTLTGGFIPLFVTANTYLAEYPVRIRRGPSGVFWVMDQGDDRDPRQLTRGRVLTVNPSNAADGFAAAVPFL